MAVAEVSDPAIMSKLAFEYISPRVNSFSLSLVMLQDSIQEVTSVLFRLKPSIHLLYGQFCVAGQRSTHHAAHE